MTKKNETTPLISSGPPELINSRFLVKASVMNNGVDKKSIMLIMVDCLENGFSIKFFSKPEDATILLKSLKVASE